MVHPQSTTRAPSPPWTRLSQQARISLLGIDSSFKTRLLHDIASYDPAQPTTTTEIPTIGLNLEVLRCESLTVAALDLGVSRPRLWTRDVDIVCENADGVVFVVDCRDRDRWADLLMDLAKFVLRPNELKGRPLLVLATNGDIEVSLFAFHLHERRRAGCAVPLTDYRESAMSLEEIENDIRKPRGQDYEGLTDFSRPFVRVWNDNLTQSITELTGGEDC